MWHVCVHASRHIRVQLDWGLFWAEQLLINRRKQGGVIDDRFVLSLNVGQTVWLSFPECCPLGFETKKSHTNLDRWPITVILHVFKWKEIFVRVYLPVCSPLILSMVDGLLWLMCGAGLGCGRKNVWARCFPSHSYLWLLLDLKCSSHCRVELFRIDQAEFLSLVELSSAVLSNPRTEPFLHCFNNFEFRHYQAKWRAGTPLSLLSGVDSGAVDCSRLK